jgi:hypothetical protein
MHWVQLCAVDAQGRDKQRRDRTCQGQDRSEERWSANKELSTNSDPYLVIPKWLLNFFTCSKEAEIDEGCHGHTWDGIPLELANQLEGEEAQVDPDSMSERHMSTRTMGVIEEDDT